MDAKLKASLKTLPNADTARLKEIEGNALANYKGEFYIDQESNYQDPVTGAHFKYEDMYLQLYLLQQKQLQNSLENISGSMPEVVQTEEAEKAPALESEDMDQFLFRTQENKGFSQEGTHKMPNANKGIRPNAKQNPVVSVTIPENARHNRQVSCPNNYIRGVCDIPHKLTDNNKAAVISSPKGKQNLIKAGVIMFPKKENVEKVFESVTLFSSMYFWTYSKIM